MTTPSGSSGSHFALQLDDHGSGVEVYPAGTELRPGGEVGGGFVRKEPRGFGKQTLLPKAVDLNQVVADMSNLLQTSIGTTIRFETRTQPGLWPALVDANQIELVLLNLAINARDAMPRGGTLTIETGNATLSEVDRPADLPAGEYAVVSVSDTGTGMSDEVPAKAFEPFFTTKEIGKGSGLGLSMALGVARQSGGTVQITGRSIEGTSIEVYLPRADSRVSSNRKAASPSVVSDYVVFLVDDGSDMRTVARRRRRRAEPHRRQTELDPENETVG